MSSSLTRRVSGKRHGDKTQIRAENLAKLANLTNLEILK
jgi:hypothetical protein